jgi:hypothetical protein
VPKEVKRVLPLRLRHQGAVALLVPVLTVSGCASDNPTFGARTSAAYQDDLESCEAAVARAHTANGAEGFFAGALVGAAHGALAGAHRGGADVGAIVGASVGAVVGLVQGLHWSRGTSVAACMETKGYRRI